MTLQSVPCVLTSDLLDLVEFCWYGTPFGPMTCNGNVFLRTGAACLLYKVAKTPKHGQQFTVLVYEKPRISELVESGPSGCLLTEGSHCHVVQESIYRYTFIFVYIVIQDQNVVDWSLYWRIHIIHEKDVVMFIQRYDMIWLWLWPMTSIDHSTWPGHSPGLACSSIRCQRWQCQDLWQNGIPPLAYFIHLYLSLFTLTCSNYSRNFWTKPFEAHTLSSV